MLAFSLVPPASIPLTSRTLPRRSLPNFPLIPSPAIFLPTGAAINYTMSSSYSRLSSPSNSSSHCEILHATIMPPLLLRNQASLQSIIDFATTLVFSESERTQAHSAFMEVINYYNSYELSLTPEEKKPYHRGRLLQLMCKYAISDHGRDNMLNYFLVIIMSHDEPPGQPKDLVHVLADLAEFEKKTEQEKDKIVHGVLVLGDHLVHHLCYMSLRLYRKQALEYARQPLLTKYSRYRRSTAATDKV